MVHYRLARLAKNDLQKIWDYTFHEWSANQAEKYIDGMLSSFEALAKGKIKGKSIDSVRTGYKKLLYGKHYIFFRFSSDQVVEIIRILHASVDLDRHL